LLTRYARSLRSRRSFVDVTTRGVLGKRRYRLKKLPQYLVLHLARFKKTAFAVEKNPTIVTFPIKNLDLNDYLYADDGSKANKPPPSAEAVNSMGVKDMKELMASYGRAKDAATVVEKDELRKMCLELSAGGGVNMNNVYDLVSNTCHDSPVEVGKEGKQDVLAEGTYRTQVEHAASRQWFEMRELDVKDVLPESIVLCEALILVFMRTE
jgi:U4/U6.U5 tri-snRNP-associated protein 2